MTPEEAARLAAPSLDRLRQRIAEGLMVELGASDFLGRSGLSLPAAQMFALLRGGLTGRALPLQDVRATLRYVPDAQFDASLAELLAHDLLTASPQPTLTAQGREVQGELVETTEAVVAALWSDAQQLAARLEPLAQAAVDRAASDPGAAFRVLHPPYLPPSSTPASRLAELAACLRFHRADAHAAAWQGAGLTIEDVRSAVGALPASIERDTDERAAQPYEALTSAQRQELVEGLRTLVS